MAVARAAAARSGLPVTVKLRSGWRGGERDGIALARRLVEDAGVAAIAVHPRPPTAAIAGARPRARRRARARAPRAVILSGGLDSAAAVHDALARTGAAAVMLARGALGDPWLFDEVLGGARAARPREVLDELDRVIAGRASTSGERAGALPAPFYPWYIERSAAARAARALAPPRRRPLVRCGPRASTGPRGTPA